MEGGRIRLGFRYVKAVGEKAWRRIEAQRDDAAGLGVSLRANTRFAPTQVRDRGAAERCRYLGYPKRGAGETPAGSLRVSLSSSFSLSPKSGGPRGLKRETALPGGYISLEDFYTRTRLDREAIENLIMVGAFDFLRVPRRQLLWQLGMLVKQPPDTVPLPLPITEAKLPQMTLEDKVAADYQVQGLSATHHPMQVFRGDVPKNVLRSSSIPAIPSGTKVKVAGCVVCRQMPGTAKGHVFITLEDECGLINVILRPQVYDKYRQIARLEPVIVVEGTLQKHDGIVNIVAQQLWPIQHKQPPPSMPVCRVRNFA